VFQQIFVAERQPLYFGNEEGKKGITIATTALSNEREKIIDQYLVIMQIGFVKSFPNFLQT